MATEAQFELAVGIYDYLKKEHVFADVRARIESENFFIEKLGYSDIINEFDLDEKKISRMLKIKVSNIDNNEISEFIQKYYKVFYNLKKCRPTEKQIDYARTIERLMDIYCEHPVSFELGYGKLANEYKSEEYIRLHLKFNDPLITRSELGNFIGKYKQMCIDVKKETDRIEDEQYYTGLDNHAYDSRANGLGYW